MTEEAREISREETFEVPIEYASERIDKFLSLVESDRSRSYFQKRIRSGDVLINGRPCKSADRVAEEDRITVRIPPEEAPSILPEEIPLEILYEDSDLIIVNKQKGMVVHPAPGHTSGTLVNALLYHCAGNLSGINGVIRPGIVHRIDKDTTGAIIACKNDFAHADIAEQIRSHTAGRVYHGFVAGIIKEDEGSIDLPIGRHPTDRKKMAVVSRGGREALTNYRVLERYEKERVTLTECRLQTGRTHQIRVHMAHEGHPLLGDPVYGSGKNPHHLNGQALHARSISLVNPRTKEPLHVTAPYPDDFRRLFKIFGSTIRAD